MISEELDRALDRASATPEQRVKIYAARDRVFAALDAQRPDPIAERERMLAAFEADQLTTANLDTLHQQLEERRETVRQAIHRAIVETHDALSPAQRKVVAEYFRTHGPGPFMGMHGPGGFRGPGGLVGPPVAPAIPGTR
jgi:Spy/CpxP family protein refolding chaperone